MGITSRSAVSTNQQGSRPNFLYHSAGGAISGADGWTSGDRRRNTDAVCETGLPANICPGRRSPQETTRREIVQVTSGRPHRSMLKRPYIDVFRLRDDSPIRDETDGNSIGLAMAKEQVEAQLPAK